jgi:hypothetical protein
MGMAMEILCLCNKKEAEMSLCRVFITLLKMSQRL